MGIDKTLLILSLANKLTADGTLEQKLKLVESTVNRYCYVDRLGFSHSLLRKIDEAFKGGDNIALEQCAAKVSASWSSYGLDHPNAALEKRKQAKLLKART